jgi:hypothetical protein
LSHSTPASRWNHEMDPRWLAVVHGLGAFFITAGWRAADLLALAGGIFFLVVYFSFLMPIAAGGPHWRRCKTVR